MHASTLHLATAGAPAIVLTTPVAVERDSPVNDAVAAPSPPPRARRLLPQEQREEMQRREVRRVLGLVMGPLLGLLLFGLLWHWVAVAGGQLPTPAKVWESALQVFADPFYKKGPNDQGIGWNVLSSLQRVAVGFGLAALVAIPLGFISGRFAFAGRMADPLISLLKPVSPLAWLPIGLLVFKAANPAAIWTIFICSLWPMLVNTAVGVRQIPQEYLNVAKVLNLSEWKIFTRILFPAALPYVLTGVRLSVGVAWLVIVAAEMLTGGVGIGFWVWDEWNNLNVPHIIIAIFVIGIVGLLLELALVFVARRFDYAK
jgi:nitrate/nitrite transport system permease protein